jgi:ubiquinone/menaquinone biosynthesis C-methylase UbiE/uncharacterized protein YbaR (Trm112 family)
MKLGGFELVCPACRGAIEGAGDAEWRCASCARTFPLRFGIPDLRIFPDPYVTLEHDAARVAFLSSHFAERNFEGMVDLYFSTTPDVPAHHARAYKRGMLAGPARARAWLAAWEAAAGASPGGRLLEIGCGTAPLLVAAENYPQRAGVDIAHRWLVVARRRLADAALEVPLICACGEGLPFPDGSFDRVVADSSLETFRDPAQAAREAFRVLRPGGLFFIATPNKRTIGPDPQTKIWAGTWLPERWTRAIIRRQRGLVPQRSLMSRASLQRLLRAAGFSDVRVYLPEFPPEHLAAFSPPLRAVARLYNLARRLPLGRQILEFIGPMLHAVARK